jgi:hypothetical protein
MCVHVYAEIVDTPVAKIQSVAVHM